MDYDRVIEDNPELRRWQVGVCWWPGDLLTPAAVLRGGPALAPHPLRRPQHHELHLRRSDHGKGLTLELAKNLCEVNMTCRCARLRAPAPLPAGLPGPGQQQLGGARPRPGAGEPVPRPPRGGLRHGGGHRPGPGQGLPQLRL